jgi:hypothetical protein
MSLFSIRPAAALTALMAAAAVVACSDDSSASPAGPTDVVTLPNGTSRQYGTSVPLGNGQARTYVIFDQKQQGRALELGVALSPEALEGLPAPMNMPAGGDDAHAHVDSHEYLLPMPQQNGTPFKFVELDWNPQGHEIPGIYTIPHFDFHFYTITKAERDLILPTDATFQQKADNLPPAAQVPQFYSTLTPPNTPTPAVPKMGVHWIDARSPEIQALLGHPELAKPFTTTFIYGSWNGRFTFVEPMITRDFILGRRAATTATQRDSVIALPMGAQASPAGLYPAAYRIAWDATANEYRIALTQLTSRN